MTKKVNTKICISDDFTLQITFKEKYLSDEDLFRLAETIFREIRALNELKKTSLSNIGK